ncbi:1-hydroxy-2-methyl-2-(E)-butenyl 4-diphosphate synthase [Campylobacter sputorum subsp. bubulus]|uniref:4-hydroxy-3-methylbut-2-en-1-yl diphosphate synthase (flavodoxin) n=1 Tax=Campylobacter sputorum subsp. sputorum TaxID=32024 RepID=A0A381DLF3_9BACT|nr:flavodoxin-dependent (E)-4-hydroxy-3-methylbut-2-enyl-diphosphate synthase [Campylobacter sputorum]ASM34753.1 1-hydroxy-2-methyl-2-(E)-butenyl 4-diphosphate synthase [Campylobacter sputorum aubsp. sputorum RM3237]KAB0581691.1 flavodoxin-dependent (E)-4-hydroxy-3-methylbut-2-enyl-diphosphate synthase [Campylobacter sputorum subsp. sputorum]QEL04944.1 1-hydroxy-2-methyl-2-(E)-butenyl 4-diphosphate synthase [Campylobacter sputorum subsp. sputorum]SUX10040.1 1-hydroxy-2-methyl-2-(E)-butenyl 4-di
MQRYKTKKIFVGDVAVGGDAPISVQSMTFSKTKDIAATLEQINRLYFAGANIVRCAVLDHEDAKALKEIKKQSPLPIVSDIHFNYRLALEVAPFVDAVRINPGNIGGKERIKAVVDACKERKIPIRIGVNWGSLEKQFEEKYGRNVEAMIESGLYNIKLLEDFDFNDIAISLKSSDTVQTVAAYRKLRPLVDYPFHLGVTEAGTKFHATIKSAMALGSLLMEGIGDTMRVSITGELEEEIKVAKAILQDSGRQQSGINIISCPTCGRLQSDLVSVVKMVEEKTAHIKEPLNVSVMGCVVNALGEAKGADVAIAFGKDGGLVIRHGEIVAKMPQDKILDKFLDELNDEIKIRNGK